MTDRLITVSILSGFLTVFGVVWVGLEVAVGRWRRRTITAPFRQSVHCTVRHGER